MSRVAPLRREGGLELPMTCLLLAIMPNIIVAVYAGGLTVYLTELAVWMAFLPILFSRLLLSRRDPLSDGLVAMPEIFVYLALAALAALVSLGLDGASETPGKIKNLLAPILLACLVASSARHPDDLRLLVLWMTLGAAVNAALGISQITTGGPMIVEPHENNVWKEALSGEYLAQTANGLFETPNALGVALAPTFVLAARVALTPMRGRLTFGICTMIVFAGLVASAHRGALLWAMFGVLVAFWPARRKLALSIATFATGTATLAAVGIGGTMSGSVGTLATRVRLWEGAFWFLSREPGVLLFGDGDAMGQFSRIAARYADWSLPMTHNTFLDQILFYGIFALGAYLIAWSGALIRACSVRRYDPPSVLRPLSDGVIGALVALAGILVLEPRADGVYSVGQVFVLFAFAARLSTLHATKGNIDNIQRTFVPGPVLH